MSTSIRNCLRGTIEKIVSDKVVSEVVIRTKAGDVTSIITTGSVKRMNLKQGDTVFAIIKATEVSVERNSHSVVPALSGPWLCVNPQQRAGRNAIDARVADRRDRSAVEGASLVGCRRQNVAFV
jgi:molybdopterin-binding protein